MQEKSQISQRKIGGWNAYKMFKMTKTKPCDKRILSPKPVEKSCGKPGKFGGKGESCGVVIEFSKRVFHKLWRKVRRKMALFCGYRGETAHFRGYMVYRLRFFHKPGEKCGGFIRMGNSFPQACGKREKWGKRTKQKQKNLLTNGAGYGILFSYAKAASDRGH